MNDDDSMKRGFWFVVLVVLAFWFALGGAVPESDAQSYISAVSGSRTTGQSGFPGFVAANITVTFNSYNHQTQLWNVSCQVSSSGTLTGQQVVCSADSGCTSSILAAYPAGGPYPTTTWNVTYPASTGFSIQVQVGGNPGGYYYHSTTANYTSPAIPPAVKETTLQWQNSTPVTGVMVTYDLTEGQYVPGSAVEVGPGMTVIYQMTSNGDDVIARFVSQTMDQWNAGSGSGTGQVDSSGNLISGSSSVAVNVGGVQTYNGTMIPTNYTGVDPTGAGTQQVTTPATYVSGMPSGGSNVTNASNNGVVTGGQGTVTNQAPSTGVVFQPGTTSTNQTGNTGALTNGQFNQGVNAMIQQTGNVTEAVLQSHGTSQMVSGSVNVSGTVSVSNLPSQYVTGVVSISNLGSGFNISVMFPSAIAVDNFPSSYVVANMVSMDGVINAISSGNSTLNNISGGISGINANLQTLISKGGGDSYIDNLISAQVAAGVSAYGQASGDGVAAGTALAGDVAGAGFDNIAAPASGEGGSVADSDFQIVMPGRFGAAMIDFSPNHGHLTPILSGFRAALAWLYIAAFAFFAWKSIMPFCMMSPEQARGNTVAGSGGQVTALIAAGVMTVATGTAVVALMGLIGGDWGLGLDYGWGSHLKSILTGSTGGNPWYAMPIKVIGLLDMVFPLATAAAYYAGRPVFLALEMKILLIYVSAIRYVIP